MNSIDHKGFWLEPIGVLPLQRPLIVKEDTSIEQAIKSMQTRGIGCILVNNAEGKLSGILTERDVMEQFIGTSVPRTTPVRELMSKKPKILSPETTVVQTVEYLGKKKFRHFPVGTADDEILGLMSVRVIIDFVAEHLTEHVLNLPPDSSVIPETRAGG